MTGATKGKLTARRIVWFGGGTAIIACASILLWMIFNRPDPSRIEQEQKAVFFSYLFVYPLIARPLPILCEALQERGTEEAGTKLVISERTMTHFHSISSIADLSKQKFETRGVPLSTFQNFFVQNLRAETIKSIFAPPNVNVIFSGTSAQVSSEDHTVSVTFSKAGFNHDFSWAMFYAELSCGGEKGTEYVYLTRDWKHGKNWYVAGVGRLSGSQTTEQVLGNGK
ncbi:MAG: hypothetical protein WB729_16305 [Candidatus Sulfotelmatobacter sp.]